MFQEGNYNVIEFYPPTQGMNQNISPEMLPNDFASYLENLIPYPAGLLTPRFGTTLIGQVPNAEKNIIEAFGYITKDDKEQILLYVQEFVQDTTATEFTLTDTDRYQLTFISENGNKYLNDTPIKIQYTLNGTTTVYDYIVENTGGFNLIDIRVQNNPFPLSSSGVVINQVSYAVGTIYSYDVASNTLSNPLKTGLSVGCVPRSETFLNTLIIYNGVDKVLTWDGVNLVEMHEFVKQTGLTSVVKTGDTHINLVGPEDILIAINYRVGNIVKFSNGDTSTNLTVTNYGGTVTNGIRTATIVLNGTIPQITNTTQIFYQAFPPPFNYIKAIQDRLWALAPGAVSLEYRNPGQEMLVFFSYKPNTLTGWFNERTGTVPSLNIASKHGVPDNLEAITYINGNIVFAGRERTQVWSGTDPEGSVAPLGGSPLIFNGVIATGVVHGNLIIDLPNDVFFISKNGHQSASSLNVAKQFAATSVNAVDPTVKQYLKTINSSNINYRACRSFKYDGGNLAGFKIGNNNVLASLFSTSLYAWTSLSGDFLKANTFLTLGNALYLFIQNKIYKYADNNDGSLPIYGDQNGTALIHCRWVPAYPQLKGYRFVNKRYELQIDYPSTFSLREENQVYLTVNGDLPKSYEISTKCRFDLRGDAFNTIPFTTDNPAEPDSIGFRFAQPYSSFKDRFKFIASKFSPSLDLYVKDGPIVIKKLKMYGIVERK